MLKIAHNVNDMKNYAKSLVTSDNAAILEKVREMPNLLSRPSAILEKVREIHISPILIMTESDRRSITRHFCIVQQFDLINAIKIYPAHQRYTKLTKFNDYAVLNFADSSCLEIFVLINIFI